MAVVVLLFSDAVMLRCGDDGVIRTVVYFCAIQEGEYSVFYICCSLACMQWRCGVVMVLQCIVDTTAHFDNYINLFAINFYTYVINYSTVT